MNRFTDGDDPPKSPGVYFISIYERISLNEYPLFEHHILYIGSAKNLYNRFKRHDTLRVFKKMYEEEVYFHYKSTDDYLELEKQLIKEVKPKFNTQHNTDTWEPQTKMD